jgi:hypothetical protein
VQVPLALRTGGPRVMFLPYLGEVRAVRAQHGIEVTALSGWEILLPQESLPSLLESTRSA